MRSDTANRGALYPRVASWLEGLPARRIVLLLAAFLSLPSIFCPKPMLGVDAAWHHSLQVAATGGSVFGRDVIFTYGPLGYLLTRSPVNKLYLLFYDLFILASLLSLYRRLLPASRRPAEIVLLIALAMITKEGLEVGTAGILFIVAGHWLWRLSVEDSPFIPLAGALAASVILFFSKANFGLIALGLIPCYGLGLLAWRRDGRRAGWLVGGFALLVLIGAACWRVDLKGYLRSSLELAGGYNEAMFVPLPARPLAFGVGVLLTLGVMAVAVANWRKTAARDWMMICPFVMLAAWLLFKNAYVRADVSHMPMFLSSLPLLVGVWSAAWPDSRRVKVLLVLAVVAGVVQLELLGYTLDWFSWTPLRYARGVCVTPWRQNGEQLGAQLRAGWPELILPAPDRAAIGRSSVDVMPWDSSLAILNGLNLKERPVFQTYAAFNFWLDGQNARFLSSNLAPDFILYMTRSSTNGNAIDRRPAAWDESMTKRELIQNYAPWADFQLTEMLFPLSELRPAEVVLLKRTAQVREYEPVSTNLVTLALGQPFEIPSSTNFEFLWLEVERSPLGKLAAFASQPAELTAAIEYDDGTTRNFCAVLPILRTGVLVNYRVESPEEIRRWLYSDMAGNVKARSIQFKSASSWAFKSPFRGKLITSRLAGRPSEDPSRFSGQ
jgi:hypothetical protein